LDDFYKKLFDICLALSFEALRSFWISRTELTAILLSKHLPNSLSCFIDA